jgi:hypothetical protein
LQRAAQVTAAGVADGGHIGVIAFLDDEATMEWRGLGILISDPRASAVNSSLFTEKRSKSAKIPCFPTHNSSF